MGNIIEIKGGNFLPTITQSKLTMVDFWAEWCGPCKQMLKFVDELANDYAGVANICKLNVDEEAELAEQYQIQSVPTIIFFKNGEIIQKISGARPKQALASIIEANK